MVSAALALLETSTGALVSALRPKASLVAENLSLRQQLAVLRVGRRPRLHPIDRAFLGGPFPRPVTLGRRPRDREAGHGHWLASPRLRTVLGVQVSSLRTPARCA